jgi:prepilin-type N-terminal cleavage/methylation domain-containing protein/prepilin-type processing-associated H-X9-DG protein
MDEARRGFTLVEMLVVVGIIVILIAITLPVLARARGAARKAKCAAHVRQCGLAVEMYAGDHDDMLPMIRHNLDWQGPAIVPWHEAIQPYTRNTDIHRCPDAPQEPVAIGPCCAVLTMCGLNGPNGLMSFNDPTSVFLFGDVGADPSGNPTYYTHRPQRLCQAQPNNCQTPGENHLAARHNDGLNVGFLDGHVKWMKRDRVLNDESLLWSP